MPRDVIARVARRVSLVDASIAASTGILAGGAAALIFVMAGIAATLSVALGLLPAMLAGALVWRRSSPRHGRAAAAAIIERVRPANNVIVTAEELQRHPGRAPQWVRDRVDASAAGLLAETDVSSIVPGRRAGAAVACALFALVVLGLLLSRPSRLQQAIAGVQQAAVRLASGGSAFVIRVTIEPPSYTGRASVTLEDPARIEALAGSVIRFGGGERIRFRFGERTFSGPFAASESGYFAIEGTDGRETRLIPLIVTRDSVPVVRVEDPGKDLLLTPGARVIPLRFGATDDLALEAMELRYTKVSGSGEQFEFQEGRLPIDVIRVSANEWRGGGRLSVADLRLEPGDSLVYRVVARDRQPGDAGVGTSDTYFVEIAGPGQVALEGVEMPPDMERYALSQQMIVLKLERLRAREGGIPRDAVVEETAAIAAEQRAVRANFIFLMGGHVEDEEVEAEQSHEIQEGRLENTARRDINTAIGHMTRAEQGLAAASTERALPPARLAVEALQRAFGRSRYLLRSLAVRSRLDMSRRLTGDTRDARTWRRDRREIVEPEVGSQMVFVQLMDAARRLRSGESVRGDEWQALAEAALRVDPSSAFWQSTSQSLSGLGNAAGEAASTGVERVIREVAPHARAASLPGVRVDQPRTPLARAWAEDVRR